MPRLGNALDFAKYEGLNFRAHQNTGRPAAPVTGQLYYDNGDNTLWWWDGSAWVSARGGASATPPATTSALGTIQLAGDLAGTATSPQIAAGVITDADVNSANKDGAVGTASMRTLGFGATQAMPGNTTLDAVPMPVANMNMQGYRVMNVATPTNVSDGANKAYVDGVASGLTWKQPVVAVATTSVGGGSAPGGSLTIDGFTTGNGDRILVTAQANPQFNGIYTTNTGGTWGRATDADTSVEIVSAAVFVSKGTVNADTAWVCSTDGPITVDTTPQTWVQFSGAAQITAGAGLTKTGNTIDAVGTANRIIANADNIDIASNYVGQASITTVGTITTGAWNGSAVPVANGGTGQTTAKAARETGLNSVGYYTNLGVNGTGTTIAIPASSHGLRGSRGLIVQVVDVTTNQVEYPDISIASNGDVTITYGANLAANSKLVTIIG